MGWKSVVKRVPGIVPLWRLKNRGSLRIARELPAFVPNSSGRTDWLADMGLRAARETVPCMLTIAELNKALLAPRIEDLDAFVGSSSSRREAELRELFNRYGSDKGNTHDYYRVYFHILSCSSARTILEIGLGTNNTDVVSNMGRNGRPGASLRAFRDFLPNASIFGADVDRRVLFSEERIETLYVDQSDENSIFELRSNIGHGFDLVIDDGLHAPDANIRTLGVLLTALNPGGWYVVEDICFPAAPMWRLVGAILPSNYETHLLRTRSALMFLVHRAPSPT